MNNSTIKILRTICWIFIAAIILVMGTRLLSKNEIKVDETAQNWNKLLTILSNVEERYVDSINYEAVTEEIISSVLKSLDPHSLYFPPKEMKEADSALDSKFGGIGIEFNVPNDTVIVSNVVSGGPSEMVGILPGDRIIQVDGENIAGVKMPQDTMVSRMRGEIGTHVSITVKRPQVAENMDFMIKRALIPQNSIDVFYMVDDTTGYIKLSKFSRSTYAEFMSAMDILHKDGMKRLIFDLRDNLGGYLDPSLLIANEFLPLGDLIVYMEGRVRDRENIHADGRGKYKNVELSILINESSASSSEILAGAIQDNDRGTIYGRRSFGKGLVQEPIYYSDGSGIRLTIAKYYTPSGRLIQKPYKKGMDYDYDIIERYNHGEMVSADSIQIADSLEFYTKSGRVVYGGGGIIPDIFVPIDTTRATDFFVKCNRQSTMFKFAMSIADQRRSELKRVNSIEELDKYLSTLSLESNFLNFAAKEGIVPKKGEWAESKDYMMTYIKAMIGRYSALDEEAFYHYYHKIDNVMEVAMKK